MTRILFDPECPSCSRLLDNFGVCWSCGPVGMVKAQVLDGVELGMLGDHARLIVQGVFAVGMSAADLRVLGNAVLVAAERLEEGGDERRADALQAGHEVGQELDRAMARFGPFASAHEGYAVLLEEVDELKAEIWKGRSRDYAAMHAEAVQVAAMALRFIADVTIPAQRGAKDRQA